MLRLNQAKWRSSKPAVAAVCIADIFFVGSNRERVLTKIEPVEFGSEIAKWKKYQACRINASSVR